MVVRHSHGPSAAPAAITTNCIQALPLTIVTPAADAANNTRGASGVNVRAILRTPCATTATATSLRACTTAPPQGAVMYSLPSASTNMMSADGSVNAINAASAPG